MSANDLEDAVLSLPLKERAELAQKLLESLDSPSEGEARQLWLQEARRRADEIDEGKVELVPSDELERQVQKLFR